MAVSRHSLCISAAPLERSTMSASQTAAMIAYDSFLLRCCLAVALGLLIGLDREIKKKPLGARAYMLICLGCCALTMLTLNLAATAQEGTAAVDPSRTIQGIVGGIGFLGAGAIMSTTETGKLRGVGSGAAIWVVGVVGIAVGFGFIAEAASVALLAFLILTIVDWAQQHRPDLDKGRDTSDGED
ncbi:MgtC/SapB family protein (plasmid) [Phaeobacter inhibens]|nr:MgtC/SapB family protein [Phaeobacter inhibens]UWR78411.1 MgtC/SapB family protein [Phaeobacter inhibens]UWR82203.1 MgtC/SapB family protein [Phaeobacter inhibens]UWR98166.1 MgtC/SapB family protein [Phaeobacter inhibens]UWS09955.1 MgtC/SapB family protein [Phaeobacter inhibens]